MTSDVNLTASVPTAPGRWPLVGHLVSFLRDPLGFLTSMQDVGGIVRVLLVARPIHVVTAPELVYELLTRHASTCVRGAMHDAIRVNLGAGMLAIDGAEHRDHRRTLQPHFQREKVADYVPAMSRLAEEWSAGWQAGQVLELGHDMHALALDVVTTALFGMRLSTESAHAFLTAFPDRSRD
jgi:cytochrome P450